LDLRNADLFRAAFDAGFIFILHRYRNEEIQNVQVEINYFSLFCILALDKNGYMVLGEEINHMDTIPDMQDMRAFSAEQAEWSRATFGADEERGPAGPLKHLAKEVAEAMKSPDDIMEYVDCLFLTLDASRRAGFSYDELLSAAWKKLEINKARKWSKPTSDEPVEHDRNA
jgi:hypothetical protein